MCILYSDVSSEVVYVFMCIGAQSWTWTGRRLGKDLPAPPVMSTPTASPWWLICPWNHSPTDGSVLLSFPMANQGSILHSILSISASQCDHLRYSKQAHDMGSVIIREGSNALCLIAIWPVRTKDARLDIGGRVVSHWSSFISEIGLDRKIVKMLVALVWHNAKRGSLDSLHSSAMHVCWICHIDCVEIHLLYFMLKEEKKKNWECKV